MEAVNPSKLNKPIATAARQCCDSVINRFMMMPFKKIVKCYVYFIDYWSSEPGPPPPGPPPPGPPPAGPPLQQLPHGVPGVQGVIPGG